MGTKLNRWVMWLACVKLYVGRDELLEGPDLLVAAAAPPAASAGGAGGGGAGARPVGLACASGEGTAAAGAAEPAGNANACLGWGCYELKCSESGQPLSHQEQGRPNCLACKHAQVQNMIGASYCSAQQGKAVQGPPHAPCNCESHGCRLSRPPSSAWSTAHRRHHQGQALAAASGGTFWVCSAVRAPAAQQPCRPAP